MARRRKVNIDTNPLQSVTIGRTDTKKYGWIGTLFLFIIFIVVIYFLPDIQKAYRDYLYNKAFTNNYVVNNKLMVLKMELTPQQMLPKIVKILFMHLQIMK